MKKRLFLAAAAVSGLGIVTAPPLAAQKAATAQRDWSRTVVQTPEGGFRMGNPNARVKLVEYGSLTCPHCADFSRDAMAPLTRNYVKSGKVSYEYRSFVLNGIDVTATLLARCGGPANFFRLTENMFATQDQWVGKISGLSEAQKAELKPLPIGQQFGRIADLGGLTQIGARHGVPAAQGKRCLADAAALERLGGMAEAAEALGITGTPTFFINGARTSAHDWADLEPLIRKAGG
jgi:protein-disulfide isomerase